MYLIIESEFKRGSWYKRDTKFILILYIRYMVLSVVISGLLGSIWYSYVLLFLLIPSQYSYIFLIVKKQSSNGAVKYWSFKKNIKVYMEERISRDTKLLVEICKKNHIDTRPKVLEAIKHYQILIPRNIIGSGLFLSLIAIIISIVAFSFDEYNNLFFERLQFIISLFMLVGILYAFFNYTVKQLASVFGRKALYKRMEDILSSIYFKALIK